MLCSLYPLPEGNKVSQPPNEEFVAKFFGQEGEVGDARQTSSSLQEQIRCAERFGAKGDWGNHFGWGGFCELLFEFFWLVISKLVVDSLTYLSSCDAANGIFFFLYVYIHID